jgi:hypothetical protein
MYAADLGQQLSIIGIVAGEISVRSIDNQQRRRVVFMKETCIGA